MGFLASLRQVMKHRFLTSWQDRGRSPRKFRSTFRPRLEALEDRRLLSALVVGDFNGDQRLDMAVINDGGLTVLLNQGNGAFLAVPVPGLANVGEGPASLVAGDFNGDGKLDLAVVTTEDRPGGGGCITVLLGQGDGSFQQAFHLNIHGIPSALVAGDFNGDGKLDLAVATVEVGDRPGGALRHCWAWATVAFRQPSRVMSMVVQLLWCRETSTATANSTWPWRPSPPTGRAAAALRRCWARGTAAFCQPSIFPSTGGQLLSSRETSTATAFSTWRCSTTKA